MKHRDIYTADMSQLRLPTGEMLHVTWGKRSYRMIGSQEVANMAAGPRTKKDLQVRLGAPGKDRKELVQWRREGGTRMSKAMRYGRLNAKRQSVLNQRGSSVNGRPVVSKTTNVGSIPTLPGDK